MSPAVKGWGIVASYLRYIHRYLPTQIGFLVGMGWHSIASHGMAWQSMHCFGCYLQKIHVNSFFHVFRSLVDVIVVIVTIKGVVDFLRGMQGV
jgi:hypothetical protein